MKGGGAYRCPHAAWATLPSPPTDAPQLSSTTGSLNTLACGGTGGIRGLAAQRAQRWGGGGGYEKWGGVEEGRDASAHAHARKEREDAALEVGGERAE